MAPPSAIVSASTDGGTGTSPGRSASRRHVAPSNANSASRSSVAWMEGPLVGASAGAVVAAESCVVARGRGVPEPAPGLASPRNDGDVEGADGADVGWDDADVGAVSGPVCPIA